MMEDEFTQSSSDLAKWINHKDVHAVYHSHITRCSGSSPTSAAAATPRAGVSRHRPTTASHCTSCGPLGARTSTCCPARGRTPPRKPPTRPSTPTPLRLSRRR